MNRGFRKGFEDMWKILHENEQIRLVFFVVVSLLFASTIFYSELQGKKSLNDNLNI